MSMAFTFTAPGGQPFPAAASVTVTYSQVPTGTIDREDEVTRPHVVAARTPDADTEELSLIMLGSVDVLLGSQG